MPMTAAYDAIRMRSAAWSGSTAGRTRSMHTANGRPLAKPSDLITMGPLPCSALATIYRNGLAMQSRLTQLGKGLVNAGFHDGA